MSTPLKLHQFKVLTFDCYGTLINWEEGIINALKETKVYGLVPDGELLSKVSSYSNALEKEHPTMLYPQILENAFLQLAGELGLVDDAPLLQEQAHAFGASIKNWPAFPDSPAALQYLQQHYKLVILSNVDRDSFAHSEAKLGVKFDMIVTAQDVGTYKPDHNNFNSVLAKIQEAWGHGKEEVLHTFQSLFHDAVPATELGIHTSHIKRAPYVGLGAGGEEDKELLSPKVIDEVTYHLDWEFPTLEAMAEAHRNEEEA